MNKFHNELLFELDGFREKTWYGGFRHRSISGQSLNEQFKAFAVRVHESLGKEYLPVYRMADGEFSFLLGWQPPLSDESGNEFSGARRFLWKLHNNVKHFRTSKTCWGEEYSRAEKKVALNKIERDIEFVSRHGILALYFAVRRDKWGEQYFPLICRWFEEKQIDLAAHNFVPFYFVYALLNGPRRKTLYEGKHVLVATHMTPERKSAIENGLMREGVSSVQFLGIAKSKSVFDELDLSAVKKPVDIALVAGGIGSVNILRQLAPLSVPCIDCGICIECFVNPKRRLERPFLIDDECLPIIGH